MIVVVEEHLGVSNFANFGPENVLSEKMVKIDSEFFFKVYEWKNSSYRD
jgi:hypothetical protein